MRSSACNGAAEASVMYSMMQLKKANVTLRLEEMRARPNKDTATLCAIKTTPSRRLHCRSLPSVSSLDLWEKTASIWWGQSLVKPATKACATNQLALANGKGTTKNT